MGTCPPTPYPEEVLAPRTSNRWRRPHGVVVLGALGAVATCGALALASLSAPLAGASSTSPENLWAKALSASKSESSVHYVEVSTSNGERVTISGDVDRVAGTQFLTFSSGSKKGSGTISVVGGVAYVNADAYGLQQALGMPQNLASQVAGTWISITPADSPQLYAQTAAELTMASVISNFDMKGPFSSGGRGRLAGVAVTTVKGYLTGTSKKVPQVFYLSARDDLPLYSVSQSSGKHSSRMTAQYSHWGETVSVTAPKSSVPITQLLQGNGSSPTTTVPGTITV